MTDQAIAGAADAGTQAGAAGAAATPGSQAASSTDIFASLQNAESRQWVESKGHKTLDPLVESARYADKVQTEFNEFKAKALTPPAPDAKPEELAAFYSKLGRPETADGYEFKLPADMPPDMPYDDGTAKAFKQQSHAAGLAPRQAQQLHDWFVTSTAQQITQQAEAAHGELTKAWGDPASETYKANVQLADKFIQNNGGDALLAEMKVKGLLSSTGAVLSPVLAQAMAKIGRTLYAEDGLAAGSQATPRRSVAETLFPPENDVFARK